jgi:exosortase
VTEAIALFGIPAQLEGNVIRVSTGIVGVNEACSGVRSVQTSLMIGLLFGELKRLSTARRVALLAGAIGIAVVANFARAFFLVWISAAETPAAANRWHDPLGYTILGLVFLGTMLLASRLGVKSIRSSCASGAAQGGQAARRVRAVPAKMAGAALVWRVVFSERA